MTSPRDEVDNWLEHDVMPLHPPAGTLDRIQRRARQRKTRQATFAAAGCAVVLAAAVVTPQLITTGQQTGRHDLKAVAVGSSAPAVQLSGSNTPKPQGKGSREVHRTRLSTTTSRAKVPPNFQPTSVTFVGADNATGGVVGAVIGQAGTPGHCATSVCTSLAGTSTYGQSWYGVSAPVTSGPAGSDGVSQLRFASLKNGWAYGPALWETSDGGWPWKPEATYGQRVIDVEAAPTRAFAVFGTCTGSGLDYSADCSSYSLWTSLPGSTSWQAVSVPAAYQTMQSPTSAAPLLVISGPSTAYLLTPSGELLSGPVTGGAWQAVGQAKCKPGPAGGGSQTQNSGAQGSDSPSAAAGSQSAGTTGAGAQGSGAQFASGPKLLLACDSQAAGGGTRVTLYASTNGASWRRVSGPTVAGSPTSLTSAVSGQAVLATTAGIEYSANGGRTWQAASFTGGGSGKTGPAGGFSYVGMTNATQGVAVPADSALGSVYVTSDGGKTWQANSVSSG